jgi:hypothetical protein
MIWIYLFPGFSVKTKELFRRILFDLAVQGEPFIVGLDSLEQAITSFIHVCFVADLHFPKVHSS